MICLCPATLISFFILYLDWKDRGLRIPPSPCLITRIRNLVPPSPCSLHSCASSENSSSVPDTIISEDTVSCYGYPASGFAGFKSHAGTAHPSPVIVPKQFATLPKAAGAVRRPWPTVSGGAGSLMIPKGSWDGLESQSSTGLSESTDFSESSSQDSRAHSPALSRRSGNKSESDLPDIAQDEEEDEADRDEVTRL